MTFSTAAVFNQNLLDFIDFYKDLGKVDAENLRQVTCLYYTNIPENMRFFVSSFYVDPIIDRNANNSSNRVRFV